MTARRWMPSPFPCAPSAPRTPPFRALLSSPPPRGTGRPSHTGGCAGGVASSAPLLRPPPPLLCLPPGDNGRVTIAVTPACREPPLPHRPEHPLVFLLLLGYAPRHTSTGLHRDTRQWSPTSRFHLGMRQGGEGYQNVSRSRLGCCLQSTAPDTWLGEAPSLLEF